METGVEQRSLSGYDDRFLLRFTIGLDIGPDQPPPTPDPIQKEEEIWQELRRPRQLTSLKQKLQNQTDAWSERNPRPNEQSPRPRFDVLSIFYTRGTIELFVILGIVATTVKDYGAFRQSLDYLAKDLAGVVRRTLAPEPLTVKHNVMSFDSAAMPPGTTLPRTEERKGSQTKSEDNATVGGGPAPERLTVRAVFILYLVASNIVLLVFLGLLLLRTAP